MIGSAHNNTHSLISFCSLLCVGQFLTAPAAARRTVLCWFSKASRVIAAWARPNLFTRWATNLRGLGLFVVFETIEKILIFEVVVIAHWMERGRKEREEGKSRGGEREGETGRRGEEGKMEGETERGGGERRKRGRKDERERGEGEKRGGEKEWVKRRRELEESPQKKEGKMEGENDGGTKWLNRVEEQRRKKQERREEEMGGVKQTTQSVELNSILQPYSIHNTLLGFPFPLSHQTTFPRHSPCLNTPASSSCFPMSTASTRELASPLEMSQSTSSLPTKHCLKVVRWYLRSWIKLDPSP